MKYRCYVGTESVRGSKGIYLVELDGESGQMRIVSSGPSRDAGFICLSKDQKYLFATMECMNRGGEACAGAFSYSVGEDGELTMLSDVSIDGQLNAHVSVDAEMRYLFCSSYLTGTVSILPIDREGRLSEPVKVIRHAPENGYDPCCHCAMMTPDGRYLTVCESGLDYLQLYDIEADEPELVYSYSTGGGKRPRHLRYSPDGKYLYMITESSDEIYVFAYEPGNEEKLRFLQIVSVRPENAEDKTTPAGIHYSSKGNLVIGSVRGGKPTDNILAIFRADPETGLLKSLGQVVTGGYCPREFAFTPDGEFLVCGIQPDDTLECYRVNTETGKLTRISSIQGVICPTCVTFVR